MTNTAIESGGFDPADHAAEAKERWGDTAAYRESARRTAGYTAEDWEAMRREADAINQAFLELMGSPRPVPRRPPSTTGWPRPGMSTSASIRIMTATLPGATAVVTLRCHALWS